MSETLPDNSILATISIQDRAIKQLETTKKVYQLSPSRMVSEFKGERENVRNYNGRQILEMLQNADDAAADVVGERKVFIILQDNKLLFANTGDPFSPEGLNSIFHSHLSPKEARDGQIGKKGLGFRSILSWANKVSIKSHELCVSFSRSNSESVFAELLKNQNFAREVAELNPGEENPIATLVCPDFSKVEILTFEGMDEYDTIIQVDLKEGAHSKVLKQIDLELDPQVLLFLNNLEEIQIYCDGDLKRYGKDVLSPNRIQIKWEGTAIKDERIYNVHTLSGTFKDSKKDYALSMAWDDELLHGKDYIYSFFRTAVKFSSPGILHGTFELNSDRNAIIQDDDDYNKELTGLIPLLIAEVSELITRQHLKKVNFKALSFLNLDFSALSQFHHPEYLKRSLIDQIKTKKVFPLINNTYSDWDVTKPCYYVDPLFSDLLDPSSFLLLIKKCDDEYIENIILDLKPRIYKIKGIIDYLFSQRERLGHEVYAKVIKSVYYAARDGEGFADGILFYGQHMEGLNFNSEIFMPALGEKFSLPNGFQTQVVNPELASAILSEIGGVEYYSILSTFPRYRLKAYQAYEIIEKLIAHFSNLGAPANIILLNKYLFDIFDLEGLGGEKWRGTPVPLLSLSGSIEWADKLYFGKEYKNELIGKLYSSDKHLLLAGPKRFGVGEERLSKWSSYLDWIGIALMPRLKQVKADEHYKNYCMRNLDFKSQIEEFKFKNYRDFRSKISYFEDSSVWTIDHLDEILTNNSAELIIEFLSTNAHTLDALEKDKEFDKSFLGFKIDRKTRYVVASRMVSYIKWKVTTNPWLTNMSGVKAAPGNCSTAVYIDSNFDGLVERPSINFEALVTKGIRRKKVEYLLEICGVHKVIGTFSQQLIYSILLKLPDLNIDREKKTKTIYNQLSANFDDKDVDNFDIGDGIYKEYHSKGEVLTKQGTFEPIAEVYYVNDKRYGDSILRHFKTIDIDRRRGMDKIKKLFGVKPLNDLNLKLKSQPNLHHINAEFEKEMEAFKPFVYVLRKHLDAGGDLEKIKDTRIKLVTSLEVEMDRNGETIILDLQPYEYLFIKENNVVYIIAPELEISKVNELKDDIKFCAIIGEVYSAILDVEAQRQQIRELFSKGRTVREELIRTEMDDYNLEKLNEARRALGVITNPKLDFWTAFALCYSKKKINIKGDTDESWLSFLLSTIPTLQLQIENCFNTINYSDINAEQSAELILELFEAANIKLIDFNKVFYPTIDISAIYSLAWKDLIQKHKIAFNNLLYQKCLVDEALQVSFDSNLYGYLNLSIPVDISDIGVDLPSVLSQALLGNFGVDIHEEYVLHDFQQIQEKNDVHLLGYLVDRQVEQGLLRQFFNDNQQARSMRNFENQIANILPILTSWLGSDQDGSNPNGGRSKRISFGGRPILYQDIYDLRKQVDEILKERSSSGLPVTELSTSSVPLKKKTGEKGNNDAPPQPKTKLPKEEIGFLGEYLVYLHLLETTNDKDSVKWVSKYARECGISNTGVDGDGFDIIYRPNGHKKLRYVEVKVSGTGDAFHITSRELYTAEKLGNNHEIFLVRNIESIDKVKIERIVGMFNYQGDSFNHNKQFSVINDTFLIKFKSNPKKD